MFASRARVGLLLTVTMVLSACSSAAVTPSGAAPFVSAAASVPAANSAASLGATPSAGDAATSCSDPTNVGAAYAMATCQIASPSLTGNLLGDPAAFTAYVLTPGDYATTTTRYPVVYVLAGYTDPATGLAYSLAAAPAPAAGKVDPILVIVSGVNGLGGGFYVNSSVSGNWEDAIVKDLIGYIDGQYRTIAKPTSRGIAGHSMGGFGATNLAMKHPELFRALFAEAPGMFDKGGATDRLADADTIASVLQLRARLAGLTKSAATEEMLTGSLTNDSFRFELAYGAAFAPDPASPTLMKFPFKAEGGKTIRDDALWATWEAGFGGLPGKVDRYKANLKQYSGIVVDYGTHDQYAWIPKGSHYLVELLKAAGVGVVETTFDGGHSDQAGDRLVNRMLPFMIDELAAA